MFENCQIVDLTHSLEGSIPTWSGGCGFSYDIKLDYPDGVRVMSYKCHAGVGTHMDAPTHFIEGGQDIAQIPLHTLIAPACMIDVSSRCAPDLLISVDDVLEYESKYGPIPKGAIAIGRTGWEQYYRDEKRYRNASPDGTMQFPGFALSAAELLMEREIVGIGIDTFSPECRKPFPIHHLLLSNDKYIIENLANLAALPPAGATVIALPIKVKEGSEAPIRAIGIYEQVASTH